MYNYVYICTYVWLSIYLYMQIYAGYMMYVYIYIHVVYIYICIYMFRIYYTIQCTYSKYVVHINICIYICALYIPILQTCYRAPEGLYIYIPAMGWGSPEFPDQQRYKSRLFKGVNACSGWWHDLTLLAIHSLMLISPNFTSDACTPKKDAA